MPRALSRIQGISCFALVLCILFVAIGCGTSVRHYKPVEKAIDNREYEKAPDLIQEAREKGYYTEKDRVLYYLDLGLTNHYAGNYEASNRNLERAEESIQELYTRSISQKGFSLITNNNQLPYYGEEYENVYINVFKALNYEGLNQTSKAFVEIRDMYEKLQYIDQKYQKKADVYKQNMGQEKYNQVKYIAQTNKQNINIKSNFKNSALGRYFNYAMYSSNNEWDEARIDLQQLKSAFASQPQIYNFSVPDQLIQNPLNASDKVLVHAIALLGKGPVKKQNEQRFVVPNFGYIKFVVPKIHPRGSKISQVKLFRDNELVVSLEKIEDVNRVATAVFNTKRPLIVFKNITRSLSKKISANVAADSADGGAELLINIASLFYSEISEQADLRTSRLLPGEFHIASFYLPRGDHILTARYYSGESLVSSEQIQLTASPEQFNLIEAIHLN